MALWLRSHVEVNHVAYERRQLECWFAEPEIHAANANHVIEQRCRHFPARGDLVFAAAAGQFHAIVPDRIVGPEHFLRASGSLTHHDAAS
jgi:hypothetical protein